MYEGLYRYGIEMDSLTMYNNTTRQLGLSVNI